MEAAGNLEHLVERLGLRNGPLRERLAFLDWSDSDVEHLLALAEDGGSLSAIFIDQLYQHLGGFTETSDILRDSETRARLKQQQLRYYQRLFSSEIDEAYVRERLQIGHVHEAVGVQLKWYLGSYRLFLSHVLRHLLPADDVTFTPAVAQFDSLLKRVFFDMTLAAEAYVDAKQSALRASEARYAHALRGANDGIWEWDLETGRWYASERWASMLELRVHEVGKQVDDWLARVHPDDLPDVQRALDGHISGRVPWLQHEYRIRRRNGDFLWVLMRGVLETDEQGCRRLAGSQTDISERQRIKHKLEYAARHDALTGLLNREQLNQVLAQSVAQLQRPGARHSALLFIDLDRFKVINDSLGHAVGDQVLVRIAERLRVSMRQGDQLARFGGDEFVMVLNDLASLDDADQVAERVLAQLREPLCFDERCLVVNVSIGVAPLLPGQGLQDALQAADIALYNAKEAGKARYSRYDVTMQQLAHERLNIESNVLQALQRNEFELDYQPVFDLSPGVKQTPVACEALLRWRHGDQRIAPGSFIHVLEESGEIIPVGYWVLQQACQQARSWQLAGQTGFSCSVNLSGVQLQEADFCQRLQQVLQQTGLPPRTLVLEITESVLLDQAGHTLPNLREIAAMGVKLALDDFGTGYCSLGYLNRFPLDIVKLDRSFLQEAHRNPRQATICRSIIDLSRNLGLQVVAEGIETSDQVEFLLQESCCLGQGFLLGRPMAAKELQRLWAMGL
ncbi:EAL domain-containing protein [Halopseudomonas salegens]|uniref:Diguanylate cyclase DosC n=1 Tax=Halopseudomonas salegens TaxID=1434072 RepID=A0A1H2DZD7_9GAMM|nr:EAL domain-containing protein [Halopseudomonas salegens]SDT88196.1 PAS domain S-box-containing protein/diguanylate cyclase (GGDEF) domain-containing protein [Halopseudomonas salegens]